MNKLTKVSLTALCGSLAVITAAKAGELSATGGATVTWTSKSGAETGNPLGMATNITFTGSGELDGGQDVAVNITHDDQDAFSSASISLTTNSLGTFKLNQGGGGAGIGGYDDNAPTAWEESWDIASSNIDLAKGVGSSTNLNWTSPSFAGTTLQVAWAPKNDGVQVNDKVGSGAAGSQNKGEGLDVVLDIAPDFGTFSPNLYAGYSVTEQYGDAKASGTSSDKNVDIEEGVVGLNFTIGPVKAGGQVTGEFLGVDQTATDIWGYKNIAWGVSFNVNDNLSLSYGKMESKQGQVSTSPNSTRVMTTESFQIAYTMGGASIKIAETEVDNGSYVSTTANDRDNTVVALTLAF